MEITIIDALLLLWAVYATHKWLSYKDDAKDQSRLLMAILEDSSLRERVLSDFATWKARRS